MADVPARTLYDKLWDMHVVHREEDGTSVLYIDRHLLHEVTSPQAFEGLRLADRAPWRNSANLAVADHNVPTTHRAEGIDDPIPIKGEHPTIERLLAKVRIASPAAPPDPIHPPVRRRPHRPGSFPYRGKSAAPPGSSSRDCPVAPRYHSPVTGRARRPCR